MHMDPERHRHTLAHTHRHTHRHTDTQTDMRVVEATSLARGLDVLFWGR